MRDKDSTQRRREHCEQSPGIFRATVCNADSVREGRVVNSRAERATKHAERSAAVCNSSTYIALRKEHTNENHKRNSDASRQRLQKGGSEYLHFTIKTPSN